MVVWGTRSGGGRARGDVAGGGAGVQRGTDRGATAEGGRWVVWAPAWLCNTLHLFVSYDLWVSWVQEECETDLFKTRTRRLIYPYNHYPYRPYRPYGTTLPLPVQTVHTVRNNVSTTRTNRTDRTQAHFSYPYRP